MPTGLPSRRSPDPAGDGREVCGGVHYPDAQASRLSNRRLLQGPAQDLRFPREYAPIGSHGGCAYSEVCRGTGIHIDAWTQQVQSIPVMAKAVTWIMDNLGWGALLMTVCFILPTWLFFRNSPRNTRHNLPEGIYIQLFMSTPVRLSLAVLAHPRLLLDCLPAAFRLQRVGHPVAHHPCISRDPALCRLTGVGCAGPVGPRRYRTLYHFAAGSCHLHHAHAHCRAFGRRVQGD